MEEYEKTLIQLSGKDFLVLFYDFLVFSMLFPPFFYFYLDVNIKLYNI